MFKLMGLWIGVYPVIAHLGLWSSHPRLAVSYLVCLLLVILLYPPRYKQLINMLTATSLVIVVMTLVAFDLDYILIYLPPVAIPLGLLMVFARSLRTKEIPLITKFAMITEGKLDDEKKIYTRRITQLWSGVFAFMVLEGCSLAIWAPIEIWSWATHIGNYVLIALVLIIEFTYRQHRFKSTNENFKQFITALVEYRWK